MDLLMEAFVRHHSEGCDENTLSFLEWLCNQDDESIDAWMRASREPPADKNHPLWKHLQAWTLPRG